MSDILPTTHIPEQNGDCSPSQLQEFNDVKQFLKILNGKARRYKTLYNVLQDTLQTSNTLDPTLKSKVKAICLKNSCGEVTNLDSDGVLQKSHTLLGATNLNSEALTYSETFLLRKAVGIGLENKYNNICDEFYRMVGVNINTLPSTSNDFGEFGFTSDDSVLLELKTKLEEEQRKYFQQLQEERALLEGRVELRLKKLPDVCKNKALESQVKSKLSELQCKIVKERTRVNIFTETSHSLLAYEELMKDIQEQKQECQREIQYLQKQKEKYQQVSCKQYEDLLKSFIQFKSSLEKKKLIYESLYGKKN